MAPKANVLVVEDDDPIAEAVEAVVRLHGCHVRRANNGRDALKMFFETPDDLVILDLGLPIMDGWQVLERIRELSDVPVLIVSAKDLEHEKVRGLLGGADDYITKPFSVSELGARVQALLRRARRSAPNERDDVYTDGELVVDMTARTVLLAGAPVDLTSLEFRLLEVFIRHPRQALSIDQLLDLAWRDPIGIAPDRVKFTVLRLRRKLNWQDLATTPLEAVRGYGYRYRPSE